MQLRLHDVSHLHHNYYSLQSNRQCHDSGHIKRFLANAESDASSLMHLHATF